MKKVLVLLICIISMTSCQDNISTLIVQNATTFIVDVYTGGSAADGDFVGTVGALKTKSLTVDLGYTVNTNFVTVVAKNCNAPNTCVWQFNVDLKKNSESSITVL